MNTTANIHPGAIGFGKTLNWIIPSIKNHIDQGQQVVLALSSIHSQRDLLSHFNPNNTFMLNTKDYTGSVVDTFMEQMIHPKFNLLIITHDALKLSILNNNIKNNWILYIDEVINPYNGVPFWAKETKDDSDKKLNWDDFITLTTETNKSFIKVSSEMPPCNWSKSISELRDLTDPNWTTWITQPEYDKFAEGRGAAQFVQELNIDILKGWKSVNIAAAAFEYTYMHRWMNNNGFNFNYIDTFKKLQINAEVYTTQYANSISLQQQYPEVIKGYIAEINDIFNKNKTIRMINKQINKNKIINAVILDYNSSGQNDYSSYTHASFEIAINHAPTMDTWLKEVHGFTADEIVRGGSAYLAYQFFGRSNIRIDLSVFVKFGLICNKTAVSLFDNYFDNTNTNGFNVFDKIVKEKKIEDPTDDPKLYYQSGSKKGQLKPPAMTNAERQAAHRAKQKLKRGE